MAAPSTNQAPDEAMTWLLHPVGEGDLGLRFDCPRDALRVPAIRARTSALRSATIQSPPDLTSIRRMLLENTWDDEFEGRVDRQPLVKILNGLNTVEASPGGRLGIVLLVAESSGRTMDISPVMHALADALCDGLAVLTPALSLEYVHFTVDPDAIWVATAERVGEPEVRQALNLVLPARATTGRDQAVITLGTGSTTLSMAALTTAVESGRPAQLIAVTSDERARLIDPPAVRGQDAVVALLLRWRMFTALLELAARTDLERQDIQLDEHQFEVVRGLAELTHLGHRATSAESLRQVVADALVRRDGTSGLAVRRYIEKHAADLVAADRQMRPGQDVEDPLTWAERKIRDEKVRRGQRPGRKGSGPLGPKLRLLYELRDSIPEQVSRRSVDWLLSPEVTALNCIGGSSHGLALPGGVDTRAAAPHLYELMTSERESLQGAGLPPAGIIPGWRVLLVWLVGQPRDDAAPEFFPVAQKLINNGVGAEIVTHLGCESDPSALQMETLEIRTPDSAPAVPTGPDGQDHSLQRSELLVDPPKAPALDRQEKIRDRLIGLLEIEPTRADAAAVVLIPTGHKTLLTELIIEARAVTAARGLPLFVTDLDVHAARPGIHLWPALTGGDRPLFRAALSALDRLELDVASRLVAATSLAASHGSRCQTLAREFAGRPPLLNDPAQDPVDTTRLPGSLSRRLALVRHQVEQLSGNRDQRAADLIRYVVLAATAIEISSPLVPPVPGRRPKYNDAFNSFTTGLKRALRSGDDRARAAWVLLVLAKARNQMPMTHQDQPDADTAVTTAVEMINDEYPHATARIPIAGAHELLWQAAWAADTWEPAGSENPDLLGESLYLRQAVLEAIGRS